MGDVVDYNNPARPGTAQPAPLHVPGAASVHDLVSALAHRLGWRYAVAILTSRKLFGMRKYGGPLQVEDPQRDPLADLVEELGDATAYAYRANAKGVPGMRLTFWALLWLLDRTARRYYAAGGQS